MGTPAQNGKSNTERRKITRKHSRSLHIIYIHDKCEHDALAYCLLRLAFDCCVYVWPHPTPASAPEVATLRCLISRYIIILSVGVLEDKSSSLRILEDNFEVLGLGLVTQVIGKARGHTLHQSLHVLHKRLQGQQLRILSVTDYWVCCWNWC